MMGQNLYGFDWKLPFKEGNPPAKAVSSVAAVALARKYNVPIRYDFTAQAPHFNYFDENGVQHEVWFEDSRSVQSKFNLMKEQGIGGISYWKIGLPFRKIGVYSLKTLRLRKGLTKVSPFTIKNSSQRRMITFSF